MAKERKREGEVNPTSEATLDPQSTEPVAAAAMDAAQPLVSSAQLKADGAPARPAIVTNRIISIPTPEHGEHSVVADFINGISHVNKGRQLHVVHVTGDEIYVTEADAQRIIEVIGAEQFTPANGLNPDEARHHYRTKHITHLHKDEKGKCWAYVGEWKERISEDSYTVLLAAISQ